MLLGKRITFHESQALRTNDDLSDKFGRLGNEMLRGMGDLGPGGSDTTRGIRNNIPGFLGAVSIEVSKKDGDVKISTFQEGALAQF